MDWDSAGCRFLDHTISNEYKFVALRPSAAEMKCTKDWNDVLQLRRGGKT